MKRQEVHPRGDYVAFVEPEDYITDAGILLPGRSEARPFMGIVTETGPDVGRVLAGDKIVFDPAVKVLSVGVERGETKLKVHLVREEHIAATVTEDS